MPIFNVGKMMEDQGLTLIGVNDDGSYNVEDGEGNARKLNTSKLLSDMKLDPKSVELKVNTPDAPLDASPVSLTDRAKMALGNTKGQLSYLKGKFEDVALHPENGMLVKNKGVWQKVDQESMDPWELTKDAVEGAISLIPAAAGSAGALLPGPAGVALSGAAAATAQLRNQSLGRLAGTYQATPEEQLKDLGWEALLNSGGQAVALGTKPTLSLLAKAGDFVGKHAVPGVKEMLASVYGSITGAGQTATRILFDKPQAVAKEVGEALSSTGRDVFKAVDYIKQGQINNLNEVIKLARPTLSKKFTQLEGELMQAVPDSFSGDVKGTISSVFKDMEKSGLGVVVEEKGVPKFIMNDSEDVARLLQLGELPDRASADTLDAVGKLVKDLNVWTSVPAGKGKQTASAVLRAKRAISDAAFAIKEDVSKVAAGKLTEYSKLVDDKLSSLFENQGLGEQFKAMNNFYKQYGDVVKEAERVAKGTYDPEIFVNKLVSNPGSQSTAKGFKDALGDLVGEEGKSLLDNIIVKEGAKGHVRYVPNPAKLTPIVGGISGAFAVGSGAVGLPAATAIASQASPRLVMNQVVYGRKFLDFLQGMNKSQLATFLKSPEAVSFALRSTLSASHQEEQDKQALLQQAGLGQ